MPKKKTNKRRGTAPPRDRTSPKRAARAAGSGRIRRRRQGKRTLYHILILLFLMAAGIVLSLTVFFKIEQVRVIGTDRYDPLEIAEFTGVKEGDNLFRVKTREIEERLLESYPYIESVEVKRALPPSIEVEIIQSTPAGVIADSEEHVLITREGKILERGLLLIDGDVILIKGVDVGEREPGERMGEWESEPKPSGEETDDELAARKKRNQEREAHAKRELEALVMLDYLWKAIDSADFKGVTNVDLTDRLNMKIIYENRLTLLLGSEADLEDKLTFVKVALERLHPDAHGIVNVADIRTNRLFFTPDEGYETDGSPTGGTASFDGEISAEGDIGEAPV